MNISSQDHTLKYTHKTLKRLCEWQNTDKCQSNLISDVSNEGYKTFIKFRVFSNRHQSSPQFILKHQTSETSYTATSVNFLLEVL